MNNTEDAFEPQDYVMLMAQFVAKVRAPWGGEPLPITLERGTVGIVGKTMPESVDDKWYFPVFVTNVEVIKRRHPSGFYIPTGYWLPGELLSKMDKLVYWRPPEVMR